MYQHFTGICCLHHENSSSLLMEAAGSSETLCLSTRLHNVILEVIHQQSPPQNSQLLFVSKTGQKPCQKWYKIFSSFTYRWNSKEHPCLYTGSDGILWYRLFIQCRSLGPVCFISLLFCSLQVTWSEFTLHCMKLYRHQVTVHDITITVTMKYNTRTIPIQLLQESCCILTTNNLCDQCPVPMRQFPTKDWDRLYWGSSSLLVHQSSSPSVECCHIQTLVPELPLHEGCL